MQIGPVRTVGFIDARPSVRMTPVHAGGSSMPALYKASAKARRREGSREGVRNQPRRGARL